MNNLKHISIISIAFILIVSTCKSQQQYAKDNRPVEIKKSSFDKNLLIEFIDTALLERFDKTINEFLHDDSVNINRQTDIVFVGSSSIRKWESLAEDMDSLKVLNRGFGGSTVPEAIYYSEILFIKHKPKKIVFYSGDNDVAILYSSNDKIIKSYKLFRDLIRVKLPDTELFILSIKPSPGRMDFWVQMNKLNKMFEKYCDETENCTYLDVSTELFDVDNNLKYNLFLNDEVHLNEEGYKIWTKIIYPILSN